VQILIRLVAAIVAVDVLVVMGLAVSMAVETRRKRQQLQDLERLWRMDLQGSVVRLHRSLGRRLTAPAVVVVLLGSATAVANPQARQLIASVPGTVADALPIGSAHEQDVAELPALRDQANRTRSPDTMPMPRGGVAPSAQGGYGSSADPAGAPTTSPQRPVHEPTKVLGVPSSPTAIHVGWSDVAGEDGYRVERSPDGARQWISIASTEPGVTTYVDAGLSPGTTYFYRVFATAPEGDSPPSDVVSATTVVLPSVATGVTAVSGSPTQIDLSWTDVDGESGYRIERSSDGVSGWSPIATTGQDVTTYSDTGLAPETTYWYRIVATSPFGDAAASDIASATTSPHPLGTEGDEAAGNAGP
jgi:Fibronectin type III domain